MDKAPEPKKTVFGYDRATGEYTGPETAWLCPATRETYLMPACTTDVPPTLEEGYAAVYADGDWQNVEDHRGKAYYSTETGEKIGAITRLGPLEDGFTFLEPIEFGKWDGQAWVLDQDAASAAALKDAENLIKRGIADIESSVTPRRLREALLTAEGEAWLADIEAQIEQKRLELSALETA